MRGEAVEMSRLLRLNWQSSLAPNGDTVSPSNNCPVSFSDRELLFLFDTRLRCAIASPNGVLLVHVLSILCLPVETVALVVIDF